MKINRFVLIVLLTTSVVSFCDEVKFEESLLQDELSQADESLDSEKEVSGLDYFKGVAKNTIIDLAPTLTVFTAAKLIMLLNKSADNLARRHSTITALLASAVIVDQVLPSALNGKIMVSFSDKSSLVTDEETYKIMKKAGIIILSSKLLAGFITYQLVKKALQ